MILCLGCRGLWPTGSVYCPRCQRSFGKRFCPGGHANPMGTTQAVCLTCNQGPLSDGVYYLPLGLIPRLLAWVVFLCAARLLWAHLCCAVRIVWHTTLLPIAFVLGQAPRQVETEVFSLVTWLVTLWLLSYALPVNTGRSLRQNLSRGVRSVGRAIAQAIKWLMKRL